MKSLFTGVKSFFWPGELSVRHRRAELTFWAFLLAVAYLPLPFGFIAWFALARPLAIISNLEGKSAFKAAYFYSFMSNLFHLYWVAVVTPPGMVAAIFILSLYPAVILFAFARLYQKRKIIGLIALPFLWVGMEYFRTLSELAFPWTDLAYSQGYYLTLIQIVSVIGGCGLSFILVVFNILIWRLFSKASRLETRVSVFIAFLAILVSIYSYGWVVIPPYPTPGKLRVSLLQGNVDLSTKWKPETRDYNFILYDSLALLASRDTTDLIIWPETAAPSYPRYEPKYFRMLAATAVKSGVPNLIGTLDVEYVGDLRKSYNSALQFSPNGMLDGAFHKMKLVPFSERSPYQDYLPFLSRQFLEKYVRAIRTHDVQWWSDFYAGDSIVVFTTDKARYAVLICFESAFPDFVRQCILSGAEFMVNITNDTWFGRSPGPFQHMRIAVFRAVENRVWMARCANSGISAIINPYGRETKRAGLYVRKVITSDICPIEEHSVFTRIGPVCGRVSLWITTIILCIMIALWLWRRLARKLGSADSSSHPAS